MENSITWLLIADASKARLFSMHKARFLQEKHPNSLELIGQFTHDKSRKKNSELVTDRRGEFGSGAFEMPTSPKVHEAEQFAHELASHLDSGRKDGTFRDLIIVAPPSFMGILHKQMPDSVNKLVSQKIEKDYTYQTDHDLVNSLINHF